MVSILWRMPGCSAAEDGEVVIHMPEGPRTGVQKDLTVSGDLVLADTDGALTNLRLLHNLASATPAGRELA